MQNQPPDQLMCFQDKTRVCGPDCMAHCTPPEGPDYRGQQWASCMLLVNSHRSGKHLVILADAVGRYVKRADQPAPPTVR